KAKGPEPAPAPPPAAVVPPTAPAVKLAVLRDDLREKVFDKISTFQGKEALLGGRMDTEIQGLVAAICEEVMPRQILAARPGDNKKCESDFFMDHTMT